jgi:hypothetical protein
MAESPNEDELLFIFHYTCMCVYVASEETPRVVGDEKEEGRHKFAYRYLNDM